MQSQDVMISGDEAGDQKDKVLTDDFNAAPPGNM
jgi:hypothetical protein